MTLKNLKTAIFAGLIAMMILSLNTINPIQAHHQPNTVYDPIVTRYIEKLITLPGITIQERTIGNQTATVITDVQQIKDIKYGIKITTRINDENMTNEQFYVIMNNDGTYQLQNKNLGIDQAFTGILQDAADMNSDTFDLSGAGISLYDDEIGSNIVSLYDSFSACLGNNFAEINVNVYTSILKSNASWDANLFYNHWCFVPFSFEHLKVTHEGHTIELSDEHNKGVFYFSNNGGFAMYMVDAEFVYDLW